jgi:RNA polymerase sigma-70 factor (ECF subfamily)
MSSDEKLLRCCRAGDAESFCALVNRYRRPLYAHVVRIVRRHEAADDVLQETFVRLWRALDAFAPQRPLWPYLRRIATNLALDHLRRLTRRRESELGEAAEFLPETAGGGAPTVPGGELETNELLEAVRRATEELSPETRACLVLRLYEGLGYRQIAETLGIALGTVMSRLARGREALRQALARECER